VFAPALSPSNKQSATPRARAWSSDLGMLPAHPCLSWKKNVFIRSILRIPIGMYFHDVFSPICRVASFFGVGWISSLLSLCVLQDRLSTGSKDHRIYAYRISQAGVPCVFELRESIATRAGGHGASLPHDFHSGHQVCISFIVWHCQPGRRCVIVSTITRWV